MESKKPGFFRIRYLILLAAALTVLTLSAYRIEASESNEVSGLRKQIQKILDNQEEILSEIRTMKGEFHKIKIRIGPR